MSMFSPLGATGGAILGGAAYIYDRWYRAPTEAMNREEEAIATAISLARNEESLALVRERLATFKRKYKWVEASAAASMLEMRVDLRNSNLQQSETQPRPAADPTALIVMNAFNTRLDAIERNLQAAFAARAGASVGAGGTSLTPAAANAATALPAAGPVRPESASAAGPAQAAPPPAAAPAAPESASAASSAQSPTGSASERTPRSGSSAVREGDFGEARTTPQRGLDSDQERSMNHVYRVDMNSAIMSQSVEANFIVTLTPENERWVEEMLPHFVRLLESLQGSPEKVFKEAIDRLLSDAAPRKGATKRSKAKNRLWKDHKAGDNVQELLRDVLRNFIC